MISTGPSNLDNAHVEFEIQLEERLKTVLNSHPEELPDDDSMPKKRRKKNLSNDEGGEQEKLPTKKKPRKRDPGLVSFLTTYHKTMWIAKYNCTFVYEEDDDEDEIGEEVMHIFKLKPVKSITILNLALSLFRSLMGTLPTSLNLLILSISLFMESFKTTLRK